MQRYSSADQPPLRAIETTTDGEIPVPDRAEGASISSMWRGTILDSIADGVFTVDDSWHITSFNRAAERITGYARQEVIGRPCYEVFRASICRSSCALRRTMDSGAPIVNVPVEAVGKDGARLSLSVSTAILRAPDGRRVGGVETFRDVSTAESRQGGAEQAELEGIVGRSAPMQRILDILPDVARSDATVLVEGPPGSGKTLVARTVHALSSRRDRPIVRVCCSALPERWLEHELFGGRDESGREHLGRVRLADGGTLVLDEVAEMSPSLQLEILQLVQERVFEPRGSGQKVTVDIRIVACTTRDLFAMVHAGTFRQDLFYQLNVVHMRMPALSERCEDIPRLVELFMDRYRLRTGKNLRGVTEEAMSLLLQHNYSGNVRELENAIEHAFVLCRGEAIEAKHLPASITEGGGQFLVKEPTGITNPRQAAEAEVIRQALERHRGNRLAAARELDMHRTTLWRKLRQYGITDRENR